MYLFTAIFPCVPCLGPRSHFSPGPSAALRFCRKYIYRDTTLNYQGSILSRLLQCPTNECNIRSSTDFTISCHALVPKSEYTVRVLLGHPDNIFLAIDRGARQYRGKIDTSFHFIRINLLSLYVAQHCPCTRMITRF